MSDGLNRLEGRVAVVTGSGQSIGFAIAERYAREGAQVVIADIDEELVAEATGKLAGAGYDVAGIRVDVSDSSSVEQLFEGVKDRFGRVDVLVNNAAIARAAFRHLLEVDEKWWDWIVNTNLKGTFLCARQAALLMAPRRSGVIINVSSVGATRAHRGMVPYDASKGGIEAVTRAMAVDLAPYGIRVVGLIPGSIFPSRDFDAEALKRADETVPLQRAGLPEDLAGPAVFLASDEADYVTGTLVPVDGGVLAQQRSPQAEIFPVDQFPEVPEVGD
jgi:3-oxoacyl-[acyl-carrier protein] reductase